MKVLDLYERATKVPVLGRGAFSVAIGAKRKEERMWVCY